MEKYFASFRLYFYFRLIGNIKTIKLTESNGARKCKFRTWVLTLDFFCQVLSLALIQCIPLLGTYSRHSSCTFFIPYSCNDHQIKVLLRDNIFLVMLISLFFYYDCLFCYCLGRMIMFYGFFCSFMLYMYITTCAYFHLYHCLII